MPAASTEARSLNNRPTANVVWRKETWRHSRQLRQQASCLSQDRTFVLFKADNQQVTPLRRRTIDDQTLSPKESHHQPNKVRMGCIIGLEASIEEEPGTESFAASLHHFRLHYN